MATFPSKVNYATGDILTATNMNDVGNAINTLNGAQISAGKNYALNSAQNVWQRGTSISVAASTTAAYTSDRWGLSTYANAASTVSRQVTGDTTNLPNIQYCSRVQRNSGQTGTTGLFYYQSVESINSIPLAGKTITYSFYIRAGATYLTSGASVIAKVYSGTGTDQQILSSWTGLATVATVTPTLTSTWQRVSVSGTVAATATQVAFGFDIGNAGTAGATDYIEVTGIQLEQANTASPYAPNGATYQAELAACQRYYIRENYTVATGVQHNGVGINTTIADTCITLPVQMRVTPTALDTANVQIYNYVTAGGYTSGTFSLASFSSPQTAVLRYTHGSAVFTAAVNYGLAGTASAGYVGFSAEL